jgi:hypothetical protein
LELLYAEYCSRAAIQHVSAALLLVHTLPEQHLGNTATHQHTVSVSKSFSLLPAGQLVVLPAVGLLLGLPEGVPPADGAAVGLADGVLPAEGVPAGVALGVLEGAPPLPADGVAAGVVLGVADGVSPPPAEGVPLGVADGVLPPAADGVADGVSLGVDGPGLPMLTSTLTLPLMLMLPAVGGAALAEMQTSSMAYCSATEPGSASSYSDFGEP